MGVLVVGFCFENLVLVNSIILIRPRSNLCLTNAMVSDHVPPTLTGSLQDLPDMTLVTLVCDNSGMPSDPGSHSPLLPMFSYQTNTWGLCVTMDILQGFYFHCILGQIFSLTLFIWEEKRASFKNS